MRIILSAIIIFSFVIVKAQKVNSDYLDAFASYRNGDYNKALNAFESLSEKEPDNSKLQYYKALSYYHLGHYQESLEVFEGIDDEVISGSVLWQARCYSHLNMKNEAFTKLNSYVSGTDYIDRQYIQKDNAFEHLKTDSRWFDVWQIETENDVEKIINEARYYSRKNEYDKAINTLEVSPNQTDIIKLEKAKLYLTTGKYSLGISELRNYRETNNTEVYDIMSKLYLQLGENQKALNALNSLLSIQPEQFDAYKFRAQIYFDMERYDQAEKDIVMLRNYFPDDLEINLLAARIFRESGNGLESLKILNALLKEDESQPDYYIERAKTFARSGNHKFAEADYSMALDLDATNGEIYYLKGIERLKMGDREGACADFRKAKMFGEMRAFKELIENNCN